MTLLLPFNFPIFEMCVLLIFFLRLHWGGPKSSLAGLLGASIVDSETHIGDESKKGQTMLREHTGEHGGLGRRGKQVKERGREGRVYVLG